ncbi:hypothetical protein SK128_008863 [Halocaridina rubra]|uniref:O-acyltransferase WSD1 C-terminal domain-containing protein n=1 Tax=Halocaridina rubra TaxID=373956 RepID=A0AAN8X422_HALRR
MGLVERSWRRFWWWFSSTLQSVLGIAIVIAVLPIVIPVLILLWIWRSMAILIVSAKYGHWVQAASGMEALFALDSVGARAVISGVAVLKGRISVSTIRTMLSERIMGARDEKGNYLHPKFRQIVEKRCGVVVWLWEENFTIARHVKQLRTDHRKPRLLKDEDDLVGDMSARTNDPFVRGQSRWEVLVAPLKRYDKYFDNDEEDWNYTAVILRVHHALGDGRSLVGLIVSALVDPPLPDPRPSPICRNPCNGCATRVLRLLWSFTHLPWVMIRILFRGDSSVLHGSRLGGDKHITWSPPMLLSALKRGRPLAGVSVNDILLTGLSAAIHKHFALEGTDVPSQVMTVIPVDVTAPGTPLSLANRISLCTVPLATDKMTPKARLMSVHHRMNILKSSPDVLVNYVALDLISNLIPSPLARRVLNTHGVTMVTSNMPGKQGPRMLSHSAFKPLTLLSLRDTFSSPTEQINLFGGSVEDIMFWIPNKSRTGLGISMLSYRGYVRVGLNVDSALIRCRGLAQQLLDDMASEVEKVLISLTPKDENIENGEIIENAINGNLISEKIISSNFVSDDRSDNSEETDINTINDTDINDGTYCIPNYSDLYSSLDMKTEDDLDTTFESDDYYAPEGRELLRADFNTTKLEIQSFLACGAERGLFWENRERTRYNKSETDIHILAANFGDDF